MSFDAEDRRIQKKIDWISTQITETKLQLNRQYTELKEALKEQEKLRSKRNK